MNRRGILKSVLAGMVILAYLQLIVCSGGIGIPKNQIDSPDIDLNLKPMREVILTLGFSGNQSGDPKVLEELEKRAKKDLNVNLDFKWSNKTTDIYDTVKNAMNSDTSVMLFARKQAWLMMISRNWRKTVLYWI